MNWTKVSDYAIRSGPWSISKAFVDGCTIYTVWNALQPEALKYAETADEAKEWLSEHLNAHQS